MWRTFCFDSCRKIPVMSLEPPSPITKNSRNNHFPIHIDWNNTRSSNNNRNINNDANHGLTGGECLLSGSLGLYDEGSPEP